MEVRKSPSSSASTSQRSKGFVYENYDVTPQPKFGGGLCERRPRPSPAFPPSSQSCRNKSLETVKKLIAAPVLKKGILCGRSTLASPRSPRGCTSTRPTLNHNHETQKACKTNMPLFYHRFGVQDS